jgi:hypothetical protein
MLTRTQERGLSWGDWGEGGVSGSRKEKRGRKNERKKVEVKTLSYGVGY